jgi:hypothetical protein
MTVNLHEDRESARESTNGGVFARLAAPVSTESISWRQDGKVTARDGKFFARFVAYIEANTVRERLDSVVPGEWDLTLELLPPLHSVGTAGEVTGTQCSFKARLQVLGVIREDVGVGDDYKIASTDAFKRAAVRFGIGHELYDYEQNWVEVDSDSKYPKPVEDPQAAYTRRHGVSGAKQGDGAGAPAPVTTSGSGSPASPPAQRDPLQAPASMLTDMEIVSCPKCGGRMWDNRLTKRNPRAPDYKCQNRSCDGVLWPPKSQVLETPQPGDRRGAERENLRSRNDESVLIGGEEELPF